MSEDQRSQEASKLWFELCKHLTTLGTGSILLVMALTERLFTSREWKGLVVVAVIAFFICVVSSLLCMYFTVLGLKLGTTESEVIGHLGAFFIAAGSFFVGLVVIGIFVGKNWW